MRQVQDFTEIYGKPVTKHILKLIFENKHKEFVQDVELLSNFVAFDDKVKCTILVRDAKSAAELAMFVEECNIASLNGFVSSIEDKTFDDLNHKFLEGYSGTVILLFEDSIEANVTEDMLRERYPNITFVRAPYGVSAIDPVKTDKETIIKTINNLL